MGAKRRLTSWCAVRLQARVSNHLREFEPARESIDWAREAIQEIQAFANSFFSPTNLTRITEFNATTGDKEFKIKSSQALPKSIRRKATEALNNLRHSFDQSLFAACRSIGQPRAKIYFPWATNPTDLQRLLENRQIPTELRDALVRQEPYPRGEGYAGGDDVIRELAKIANGKHTIGLRIGATVSGIEMVKVTVSAERLALQFGRWDPVKNEVILATGDANAQFEGDYNVAFHVALHEAEPLRDVPLQGALAAFLDKAQHVADDLEAASVAAISR